MKQQKHDPVPVKSVTIGTDDRTVFLEIPGLKPVMQMAIKYNLKTAEGAELKGEIVNTIHALGDDGVTLPSRGVAASLRNGVQLPLSGKTLVVIGGTTGLGLSAAHAFLEHGARVVVVGRKEESVSAAQERLGIGRARSAAMPRTPATAPAAIAWHWRSLVPSMGSTTWPAAAAGAWAMGRCTS